MKLNEKIIFILPSIKTGGGNRVAIELANELVDNDIKVDIIYPNNSRDINTFMMDKRIHLVSIGSFGKNKVQKILNLLRVFRYINNAYKQNSIIVTDPIMSIFIPLIKNNKVFRFIQADDYKIFDDLLVLKNKIYLDMYKFLTKRSYSYKIKYIFNSKYTFNRFIEVSGRKDVSLKLVHPAINHNNFNNKNIKSKKYINICIVARKHPLKGFIDFLKPFNDGSIHGVSHVYVVSHDDLSSFQMSKMKLIRPNSDEEIAYYMNLSHIFISTSWWEGFGLPPLEAMACGCAVVLTNAGGVNEYAIPNSNCLMYEPKNQHQLVERLNQLVSDASLQKKISKAGLETAVSFSWNKSALQLKNIINEEK